jgi:hypothetical protein
MEDDKLRFVFTGPIMGKWNVLNKITLRTKPDYIIQAGDIGYNPKRISFARPVLLRSSPRIFFCNGDRDDLLSLKNDFDARGKLNGANGLEYFETGDTIQINAGVTILFLGGSDEHGDRPITDSDIEDITRNNSFDCKFDIIVSHMAPSIFPVHSNHGSQLSDLAPTRMALTRILKLLQPKLWIFGHYPYRNEGVYESCGFKTKWISLPECGESGWYHIEDVKLPQKKIAA